MDETFLFYFFMFLLVLAVVTAVLRWTFKVNEKYAQNQEIIRLLKKLANEPNNDELEIKK